MNQNNTLTIQIPYPLRLWAILSLLLLSACSTTQSPTEQEILSYQKAAEKSRPLDLPPELVGADGKSIDGDSPLYGTVAYSEMMAIRKNAANSKNTATTNAVPSTTARILDDGVFRYLEIEGDVATHWSTLQSFWKTLGLTLEQEDATVGVFITKWAENRARVPQDFIRRNIGKLFESAYSSGQIDRYHAIVENVADAHNKPMTRVYVAHYGMEEVERPDGTGTRWMFRPSEPLLSLEILRRLALHLGVKPSVQSVVYQGQSKPIVLPANTTPSTAPIPINTASIDLAKVESATTLSIPANKDRSFQKMLQVLPQHGFMVTKANRASATIHAQWQEDLTENPQTSAKSTTNLPVYRINVTGSANKSMVSFQLISDKPKKADPHNAAIASAIENIVKTLNR